MYRAGLFYQVSSFLTRSVTQESSEQTFDELREPDPEVRPRRQKNKNGRQPVAPDEPKQKEDNSVHCDRRHDDPRNEQGKRPAGKGTPASTQKKPKRVTAAQQVAAAEARLEEEMVRRDAAMALEREAQREQLATLTTLLRQTQASQHGQGQLHGQPPYQGFASWHDGHHTGQMMASQGPRAHDWVVPATPGSQYQPFAVPPTPVRTVNSLQYQLPPLNTMPIHRSQQNGYHDGHQQGGQDGQGGINGGINQYGGQQTFNFVTYTGQPPRK
jgi:hypothetical protein